MKVSNTFREVLKIGPEFHIRADMVLKSGEQLSLKESDLMAGTFEFIDSTSASGKLEIGTVTAQQFKVNLNNFYNQFSTSELEGAVITPYISLLTRMDWRGPQLEELKRGRFTVSGPKSVGSAIQLAAWDNMMNFAQAYTKSALKYPATLGQIVADACSCCGVPLATPTFTNSGYSVTSRHSDSALTFRDVISYAAKLAGCFARCNSDGALELRWYDFSRFSLPDTDESRPWELSGILESDIKEADTAVTGVQITGTDRAKTVYTSGKDGFVLSISNNPLAQDGLQAVADTLGSKLIGMTFRPFTATANENPAIESGDVCCITDADGSRHRSIISNLDYKIYQNESYSGDAESTGENNTVYYSPAQKAQDAADTAQAGVDEAKTEITQLNGQIVLKADKGKLVAEINVSPEGIKISADKLELSGLVTIKGVADGSTIINGACIQTGKISADRIDVTDLAAQKLVSPDNEDSYMIVGTVPSVSSQYGLILEKSGNPTLALLSDLTDTGGAMIYCPGNLVIMQGGHLMTIEADKIGLGGDVDISGKLNGADLGNAPTGNWKVKMADGSVHRFYFESGILVDVD